MARDVVRVQEKQGDSHVSFRFELSSEEFYREIPFRAKPGTTMICGTFGLGDQLMLTPALRGLKETLPGNPVHVYCLGDYPLLENNPNIDLLVGLPRSIASRGFRAASKRLCSLYGRAIPFNGIINGNPEAELINAYELICKRVSVVPRSLIPDYFPLPGEIERALQALESVGVTPRKDKIVAVQPRASSLLRSLPDETIADLLRRLEQEGWRIVVFCPDLPEQALQLGYWTSRDFPDLTLRDIFAIVSLSNAVIATDSVLSHLAAALGIPSVLLYGPFASELRAKHFPRAYPLQAEVECGPCFQHGSRCTVEGRRVPSCMHWFAADMIMEAMHAVLSPDYSRDEHKALGIQLEKQGHACRMCGCMEFNHYARKRDVFYLRCVRCGSVQNCASPGEDDIFTTRRHHYFAHRNRKTRGAAAHSLYALLSAADIRLDSDGGRPILLDFGAGEGRSSKMLEQLDCEVEAFESDCSLVQRLQDRNVKYWTNLDLLQRDTKDRYDAIALLDSFQFLRSPGKVFSCLTRCLKPDGWVVLTLFVADDIVFPSKSPVLGRRPPGEVSLVPSIAGLDDFMAGFKLRRMWNSKIPEETSSLFVYRKAGDSK